jgi:hypothetical protein
MNLRHTAATFDQETLLATKRSGGVVEWWSGGVQSADRFTFERF